LTFICFAETENSGYVWYNSIQDLTAPLLHKNIQSAFELWFYKGMETFGRTSAGNEEENEITLYDGAFLSAHSEMMKGKDALLKPKSRWKILNWSYRRWI
jgi:hypothetical protein